jgi:hypothetical protein
MSASHEDLEVENECLRLQLAQAEEELRYLYAETESSAPRGYLAMQRDVQQYVVKHAAPNLLAAVAQSVAEPRMAARTRVAVTLDAKRGEAFRAAEVDLDHLSLEDKYRDAETTGLHEELDRRWETIERLNAENLDLSRRQTLLDIEISSLEAQLEMVKSLFFDERRAP